MTKTILSGVMWVGRTTVFALGLTVTLALMLGIGTTALAAVPGGPFRLGNPNTINRISQLVGSVDTAMLRIDNNGAGTALDLRVESGKPPMKVDSAAKVADLNADRVDGLDSSRLTGPLAYAHINADGTIDPDRSKNVRSSFRPGVGRYCIDFTVKPRNVVATIDAVSAGGQITQHTDPGFFECFSGVDFDDNVQVLTTNGAGNATDKAFDIVVN